MQESKPENSHFQVALDDLDEGYITEAIRVAALLTKHGGRYWFSPFCGPDLAGAAAMHVCGLASIVYDRDGGWRLVDRRLGVSR